MGPEANPQSTGATPNRELWRDIADAVGPQTAAWLLLTRAESATRDLAGLAKMLSHIATSGNEFGEDEAHLLARVAHEIAVTLTVAVSGSAELLAPLAKAERDAVQASETRA